MSTKLKIIFAGTPDIASTILSAILNFGFMVDLVITQPDRPKGRGYKLAMSSVKELAIAKSIPVIQPLSFKNNFEVLNTISALKPDVIIVVAYGLILPKALLDIPTYGCINVHVSLLPRHRGAAPIQRAILAGDSITGVTIMQMDNGLDTGDILLQEQLDITPNETSGSLHDKLAHLGVKLILKYLHKYPLLQPKQQQEMGVSYAHKINKDEAKINWGETASVIERKIRGFNPMPGCYTHIENTLVKVWVATVANCESTSSPGTIIEVTEQGIFVACGYSSVLQIIQLQDSGKIRQLVSVYRVSHSDLLGKSFI